MASLTALPGTSIGPSRFWAGLDAIVRGLSPKNAALLARRDALQARAQPAQRSRPAKRLPFHSRRPPHQPHLARATLTRRSPRRLPLPAHPAISQCEIDAWHARNPAPFDPAEYSAFLHAIGYLLPDATGSFELRTSGVDDEIASLAGPQLVCPADNARHIHI